MEYTNEFLNLFSDKNIKQENIELPLFFQGLAYYYSMYNFLYLVPVSSFTDFTKYIEIKNYIESRYKYDRIYIYVPRYYSDFNRTLLDFKISFVDYHGNELYFNTKDKSYSHFDKEVEIKYTKATQLVFKYFILNNIETSTVREISKATHLSLSTISLSLFTLYKLNVLNLEGNNTGAIYSLNKKNKMKAFTILEKYFINPIKSKSYLMSENIDKTLANTRYVFSGEKALEKYTELAMLHDTIQIAIAPTEKIRIFDDNLTNSDLNGHLFEVQKFIYDPMLFTKEKIIDKFDTFLILFFYKNRDVREEAACKQLRKELINGFKEDY